MTPRQLAALRLIGTRPNISTANLAERVIGGPFWPATAHGAGRVLALQLERAGLIAMTGRAGWCRNCILTPAGRLTLLLSM